MRPFFVSLSILTSIIGLIFIMRGCVHPAKYQKELSKETPTAVRVTQIYTEATHLVVVGIGVVSLGILIVFIGTLTRIDEWKNLYSRLIGKTTKNSIVADEPETSQREENEN
ncbi:hypothetical protein J4G08_10075 [Candidatus Poribacteria bacterium]|nr:hypothetical protein [Candidatus Poribacteria bacterium]